MKTKFSLTKPKFHLPTKSTLEVLKTYRIGSQINIKVRLVTHKPKILSQPASKFVSTTVSSTSIIDDSHILPKAQISSNGFNLSKPDDFIEPFANLTIPTTEEYMHHRNNHSEFFSRETEILNRKKENRKLIKKLSTFSETAQFSSTSTSYSKLAANEGKNQNLIKNFTAKVVDSRIVKSKINGNRIIKKKK